MRWIRVWARLLGLQRAVVEHVRIGNEGEMIASVRPGWRERDRCGVCRRRWPGYDLGEGRRRWRALDLGDDVRVRRVRRFGGCWLAVNTSKTAVAELMRVAWRSVGTILERVADEARREVGPLDGLRRIGIDRNHLRPELRRLTAALLSAS